MISGLLEFSKLATSGAGNTDAENGVSPTENCVRARIEVGGNRSSEISLRGLVGNQQYKCPSTLVHVSYSTRLIEYVKVNAL